MDEAFACPECGQTVQVRGFAPGRQVRCGFCHRLIEVPYFPRAVDPGWRRHRFGRPWWVPWAWSALGLAAGLVVLIAAVRLLQDRQRASVNRSIDRLIASSERQEAAGNLVQALLDLDAAITIRSESSAGAHPDLATLKARRRVLARRDAETVLDRLCKNDAQPFPLGDWLNLLARIRADADLASMRQTASDKFEGELRRRIDSELAAARIAIDSGQPVTAFERCEAVNLLLAHLSAGSQQQLRDRLESIVSQIIAQRGIVVDTIRGHLLTGSLAKYNDTMVPQILRALKAKGYLPQADSSSWRPRWSDAPYRLSLEVNEKQEGNYMASENRLSRIVAHLSLSLRGKEIWQRTPTAQTTVPLPNLPAYLAARVAMSRDRIEEFERLLYDNARGMIDERLGLALRNMPECVSVGR